jgi:hypothetical protein
MAAIERQHNAAIVRVSYTDFQAFCKLFKIDNLSLVEAAGVEPASEKTDNREHSCFSAFLFVSWPALRTGEDEQATSLIDLVIAVQAEQL